MSGGGPASGIQLFGLPGGRAHWPLRLGYFPKSITWATQGVASNAATNAAAQIALRQLIDILPYTRRCACVAATDCQVTPSAHEVGRGCVCLRRERAQCCLCQGCLCQGCLCQVRLPRSATLGD